RIHRLAETHRDGLQIGRHPLVCTAGNSRAVRKHDGNRRGGRWAPPRLKLARERARQLTASDKSAKRYHVRSSRRYSRIPRSVLQRTKMAFGALSNRISESPASS